MGGLLRKQWWVVGLLAAGCGGGVRDATPMPGLAVTELAAPGAGGTGVGLAADGKQVWLSWLETKGSNPTIRFAHGDGTAWATTSLKLSLSDTIDTDERVAPSVLPVGDGTVWVQWSVKQASGRGRAYARSPDDGATWERATIFAQDDAGAGGAAWTKTAEGPALVLVGTQKTLPGAKGVPTLLGLQLGGHSSSIGVFFNDVLECSRVQAALTPHGLVVAFRTRTPDVNRFLDPRSSDSVLMLRSNQAGRDFTGYRRHDGWVPPDECTSPVDTAPAVDAIGLDVASAIFTSRRDPTVEVTFADDGGAGGYRAPRSLSGATHPLGGTAIRLLSDKSAVVVWVEAAGAGAEVRAQRVDAAGRQSAAVTLGATATTAVHPRLERAPDGTMFVAWTENGRIRLFHLRSS